MTERLIEKIDRLANEAGIKEVTPEIRRFAMLVRQDVVAQWPKQADVLWASTSAMQMVEEGHLVATYLSRRFIEDEFPHPLYPTPQQRAWVGLTDDERDHIVQNSLNVALSIEEKLKEKNT